MSGCAGRCRAGDRRRIANRRGDSRRLATDGPAVAVVDLNEQAAEEAAAAIRERGGRAVAVPADVTDRAHV